MLQIDADYVCPYCGAAVSTVVDPSAGAGQEYVEDCQVCCKPVRLVVAIDPDDPSSASLDAFPENE
jgi:hypothetical protein